MGWIVFGVLIAIALFFVSIYNRLVSSRNGYKNAFAQIDVQLTRRHDLIPNLVETAKGYIKHERETLEAVIAARNSAVSGLKRAAANPGDPASVQQLAGAEAQLNGALGRLFAVAEAYPDLKANQNMMQLSEELTSTENKVAFARQAFNDAVMNYNNTREMFPNSVVAGMFMFTPAQLLEIEAPEKRAVGEVHLNELLQATGRRAPRVATARRPVRVGSYRSRRSGRSRGLPAAAAGRGALARLHAAAHRLARSASAHGRRHDSHRAGDHRARELL
jgi:LemA protein